MKMKQDGIIARFYRINNENELLTYDFCRLWRTILFGLLLLPITLPSYLVIKEGDNLSTRALTGFFCWLILISLVLSPILGIIKYISTGDFIIGPFMGLIVVVSFTFIFIFSVFLFILLDLIGLKEFKYAVKNKYCCKIDWE